MPYCIHGDERERETGRERDREKGREREREREGMERKYLSGVDITYQFFVVLYLHFINRETNLVKLKIFWRTVGESPLFCG